MIKNKKKFTILSSTGLLLGAVLFVCVSTIAPVLAAHYNVIEDNFFIYVDEEYGNTYKCFRFKDDEGHTVPNQVAIAWGEIPGNTPANLILPTKVTYDETEYTVKAIAKHGFRYCDFETIKLPNTIEQIEAEAFAYCLNLGTIGIPYLVDKIYPSTFMDCRALSSVRYLDENGAVAFGNDHITEIGDHAFDSCVSLKDFYCPKNVTYFGESSFKNCRSLINFYFPSEVKEGGVTKNPITVRPYAFADCKSLIFVYFETNMAEVDNYAFVDCHTDLRIKYNGTSIPDFSRDGVGQQTHWRDEYIADNLTSLIDVDVDHPTIYSDDQYPCLRYTIENSVVKLDSAQDRPTLVDVIPQSEIDAEGEYAVIYKFDTPSETIPGCFNVATGALTIPNTVNGKTVKIIEESAFANNTFIKSIKFNADLVQICNRAFYNCLSIESLDFTSCTKLKEVSYWVFHDHKAGVVNTHMTSLILPDCLEYIGGYAFGGFYYVNELHLPSNVKAIDDLAFYQLGNKVSTANVNLVLPKSLNDKAAQDANFKHVWKVNSSGTAFYHNDYTYIFAVGKYAFSEANCILTCEMQEDTDHENDMTYTTSFYSNSFNGSSKMIRFKAGKNLQYFGKDAFKNCSSLREVFLTTEKSDASGCDYPWSIDEEQEDGLYGGSLFWGAVPELVVYVDGDKAPGLLDSYTLDVERTKKVQNNYYWNSETVDTASYTNEWRPYDKSNTIFLRNRVPTYYNVDFDSVVYWNPKNNSIATKPVTLNDYNSGRVAIVKNSDGKYIVARYFYNNANGYDKVDLTKVPGISDDTHHDLVEIGNSAFGRSSTLDDKNDSRNKQPGLYFILPYTITKIGERAFYRATSGSKGVDWNNSRYGARIITYKNSDGNYLLEDGSVGSETDINNIIATINADTDYKRGFCVLPSGLTYIGNAAFYNNIFVTVRIGSAISYIGPGAFYCNPYWKDVSHIWPRTQTTTFVIDSNSIFSSEGNGIYYIGSGVNKKMLIAQANATTGNFTVASGTKAIGLGALANTSYSSITLNSGLTTIYGAAFTKNYLLTTINGGSDLRYIGTMENLKNLNNGWDDEDYTEVWDNTMKDHISITDYRGYAFEPKTYELSMQSAFAECNNLTTWDFTQLTELRKIGIGAFKKCGSLINLAGSKTYQYVASNPSADVITRNGTDSQGVLDLSNCHNLRSINKDAFVDCTNIKFLHLPNNIDTVKNQSALYIAKDIEISTASGSIFTANKGVRILVGNPAEYAAPRNIGGKYHKNTDHYSASCFGTQNNVYYYAGEAGEYIISGSADFFHYWAKDSSGVYHLLWNETDAKAFFGIS